MRQRRLEHLICSKFYFSNNHKRYPVPLQLNLLDHARCKHEVPKEKKKIVPDNRNMWRKNTQKCIPRTYYLWLILNFHSCLHSVVSTQDKHSTKKQKLIIQGEKNMFV